MAGWLQVLLDGEFWREALATALVIVAAGIASRAYVFVVDRVGMHWVRRTASELDDRVLHAVRKPGAVLVFLVGVYISLHRYKFRMLGFLDGVLFVAAVIVVFATLIRVSGIGLQWYGEKIRRERKDEAVAREIIPLADKLFKVVLMIIALVIVLDWFRIDIKSILVTLGVGSLAVGLALQDTLANMFGGFAIMLDRPFRSGDRIQLQSGEAGDVQAIGIRSTTVLMPDGNLMIIPNSVLVKTLVINHSIPDSSSLVRVEIGVAYGSEVAKVKAMMLETASEDPAVRDNPAPAVFFASFGESALSFILTCYARSFTDKMAITDRINTALAAKFEKAGIEIPFPVRTVYLRKEPASLA